MPAVSSNIVQVYADRLAGLNTGATRYTLPFGDVDIGSATLARGEMVIGSPCTISGLEMTLTTAPGAGKSWAFTYMKNGVATALTCTVADTAVTAEDAVNSFTCVAGDTVTLRIVPTGTPTAAGVVHRTVILTNTTAGTVQTLHAPPPDNAFGNGEYIAAIGGEGASDQDLSEAGHGRGYCPFGGTVKAVYSKDASLSGGAHVYTLKKNNVDVPGAAVTVNNTTTVQSVTGLSATFVENDYLSWLVSDSGVADVPNCITLVYEPDSAYYAVGGSVENIHGSTTSFFEFGHVEDAQVSATESDVWTILGSPFTIAGLTVNVITAPGAGEFVTFEYYDNGSPTGVTVTISGSATSASTGVTYSALAGAKLSLKKVSSDASYNPGRVWWYSLGTSTSDVTQYRLMLAEVATPDVPTLNITAYNIAPDGSVLIKTERGRDSAVLGNPARAGQASVTLNNLGMHWGLDEPTPGLAVRLNKMYDGEWYHMWHGNLDMPGHQMTSFRPTVTVRALGTLTKLAGKKITTSLLQNVTVDQALDAVFDAAGFPAHLRDFDTGEVTLLYYWASEADAMSEIQKLVNSEGITAELYEQTDGTIVFRSRSARYTDSRSANIQTTFRQAGAEPLISDFEYVAGYREIINRATHARVTRLADTSTSVVWSQETPPAYLLPANTSLTIWATTSDPVMDVITPVLGTDYTVSTGSVTVTLDRTSGSRFGITFTSGGAPAAFGHDGGLTLSQMQLRGTAIPQLGTDILEQQTIDASESIATHGLRPWQGEMSKELDWATMRDNLDAIVTLYQSPRGRVSILLEAARGDEANEAMTKRDIGDRIRVINTDLDFDGELWIERVEHEVVAPAGPVDGTVVGREKVRYECSVISVAVGSEGSGLGAANPYDSIDNGAYVGDIDEILEEDIVSLFDREMEHRFIVTAHRGDINPLDGYPENTLIAARQAARKGAPRIEFDVQRSSDGIWYLMHDTTVDRTTGGTGAVSATTAAAMDALVIDGGLGYRAAHSGLYAPPTLISVLNALRPYDVTVQIENKETTAASYTALVNFLITNDWHRRVVLNADTQANAQAINAADSRIPVMGATGVTAWSEIDIVQYEASDAAATEANVLAAAPKPVSFYITSANYATDDVVEITRAAYRKGARYFTTHNIDASLATLRTIQDENYNADGSVSPSIPSTFNDEFSDGVIDSKWTKVNDPASGRALSEAVHDGYLYVGLEELGTDTFDNLVRIYQTPPTGTATMSFVIRATVTITGHLGGEMGEFATACVYLGNSTNDEGVGAGIQINWTVATDYRTELFMTAGGQQITAGSIAGMTSFEASRAATPGEFVYLKLSKTTANAYTSANTYKAYVSGNGLIWHEVGSTSYTFTTACDEVGIFFRRPKSQGGTPEGEALVDFFRKTA